MVSFSLKYVRFLLAPVLFLGFSQVHAQVTLVNYDFNTGTSYATLTPIIATGITAVAPASPTEFFTINPGTTSSYAAFAGNMTAGQALYMPNSDGTNARYYQFQLSGDSLVKYSAFKVYVQAQRSPNGAQTLTLAYSTDDITYTNLATPLSLTVADSFTETVFNLSAITAINNPTGNLYFRLLASGASGTGTLRIDNFQVQGVSVSTSADLLKYFRSTANGDWASVSTWQMSSDQATWVDATITPNSQSNTIEISHLVTLDNIQTIDQTVVKSGGELRRTGGLLTINDGIGNDLEIFGIFNHHGASTLPIINTNATCLVKTSGIIQVDKTITNLSDLLAGNSSLGKVFYENNAVFNWNNFVGFNSVGQTYFPSVSPATAIPVFRVSANISLPVGSTSLTTFNGVFEANGNVSFDETGFKTFRNGIRGTGNVTQFDATTAAFFISGNTAELGGTGTITLNKEGMTINAGCVTTLSSNKVMNATGFFGTLTLVGTLDAGTYTVSGTTSFSMEAFATLITAHTLGISGSIQTSNPIFPDGTANFLFNGSVGQQQTGGLMPQNIYTLTINNASGVNLVNNTNINSLLTFTQGHLYLGVSGTYNLTVTGSIINADATKFVVTNSSKTATTGFLIQDATAGKLFPIGSTAAADHYTPAFVTSDASNPIYKARVFDGVFENGTGNLLTQQEQVVKKTWQILPESGDASADIKLQWNTANEGILFTGTRSSPATVADLRISGTKSSSTWANLTTNALAGADPFSLSTNGVNSATYDFFTAYNDPFTPLPISLLTFAGHREGNGIKLAWTTTAEINSKGFEVQRSADLKDFVSIGFVQAAQPGQAKNSYTFTDENFSQASYYRLKQIDLDGQYAYIKPIFVDGNSSLSVEGLLLYPNPTEGKVHLALPDNMVEAHLKLVSANGIIIAEFTTSPETVDVKLSEHLSHAPAGLYFLQTIQGNQTYGNKLLKR